MRAALLVLTGLLIAAAAIPAAIVASLPAAAQTPARATEVAQETPRQRIIITPRREPGPNAKRECQARLVEQHRPSGTVIVPVMNCWWQ